MKLKRFLLRYDPPGVGLEIEENGSIDVIHKDLPNSSDVTSIKGIHSLVDQLIEGDPRLLTKRRHGPALVKLLGRLYHVDVPETDDDGGAATGSCQVAEPARGESPEPGIRQGMEVVIVGLQAPRQNYNGELAKATKVNAAKMKYEVSLVSSGEVVKIKGLEHLVPTAPKNTSLAVGTHVAIRGLRNHIELNGCLGRVVECHEESHRFEVRATESGQLFRVKQENLIPIEAIPSIVDASKENRQPNTSPRVKESAGGGASSSAPAGHDDGEVFEAGSTVQLYGLKTAMNYNGQQAEVLSVDRVRSRYEIRLHDGSVKTIRAENVRLIEPAAPPPPSKTSPRSKRKDGATKTRG